jgi:branched-chain amino acid aminotransferase
MDSICVNGNFISANDPAIYGDDLAYRFGDGLFETMLLLDGKIILENLHFERLFAGMNLLHYHSSELPGRESLKKKILELAKKNGHQHAARIRLAVSRGRGNIDDLTTVPSYLISSKKVKRSSLNWQESGLCIDIFPDARKAPDVFSHLKSSSFLAYALAKRYAMNHDLDDALVLNSRDKIADASIFNLFLLYKGKLITPALSEGCVDGVMRRYIMEQGEVEENSIGINDLLEADEIFLTNAIQGIRWVKKFRNKIYGNEQSASLFRRIIQPLRMPFFNNA